MLETPSIGIGEIQEAEWWAILILLDWELPQQMGPRVGLI
jgi:hypothetical protein